MFQGPACYDALSAKLVEQAGGPQGLHRLQWFLLKLKMLGEACRLSLCVQQRIQHLCSPAWHA